MLASAMNRLQPMLGVYSDNASLRKQLNEIHCILIRVSYGLKRSTKLDSFCILLSD
jgi:hypothetical protein